MKTKLQDLFTDVLHGHSQDIKQYVFIQYEKFGVDSILEQTYDVLKQNESELEKITPEISH